MNGKISKNIKSYGYYILIAILIGLSIFSIILIRKNISGFTTNSFGNIAKEFNFINNDTNKVSNILEQPKNEQDRYILNLGNHINIVGFKIDTFDISVKPVKFRLHVKTDILDEFVTLNKNVVFTTGKYYDIRNSNYIVNKLLLVKENVDSDIDDLNNISNIKIYGITQFDKLVSEDIDIVPSYDTGKFTINFKKLTEIDNIEYYYIVVAKYNRYKEFLNKKIIRLNNNKINFIAELKKLVPLEYIDLEIIPTTTTTSATIGNIFNLDLNDLVNVSTETTTVSENFDDSDTTPTTTTTTKFNSKNELIKLMNGKINNTTTLKEASIILHKYRNDELMDVYKLILKNQYLENNKDVAPLLNNINEYSTMKFLSDTIIEDNESFKRKYMQNYYHYQSDEIKLLLTYVYDLIENYEDACNDYNCTIVTPTLDIYDNSNYPYYYKIGVGYVRLDILGNEIYSPVTTYRNKGEILFKLIPDEKLSLTEKELTTGEDLYNKLKLVNNNDVRSIQSIIGSNYPNNFYISEQNLNDYVELDKYKQNKYSPIQFNIGIIDTTPPTTTIPSTTTTQSSAFVGNYNNAEDSINDLLS